MEWQMINQNVKPRRMFIDGKEVVVVKGTQKFRGGWKKMNTPTELDAMPQTERPQTIREQLVRRKDRCLAEICELNEAIAVLDKNPNFEEIHNTLNRLNLRGLIR